MICIYSYICIYKCIYIYISMIWCDINMYVYIYTDHLDSDFCTTAIRANRGSEAWEMSGEAVTALRMFSARCTFMETIWIGTMCVYITTYVYMGGSINGNIQKKMVGLQLKIPSRNGWFGGTPIFGNLHIYIYIHILWRYYVYICINR